MKTLSLLMLATASAFCLPLEASAQASRKPVAKPTAKTPLKAPAKPVAAATPAKPVAALQPAPTPTAPVATTQVASPRVATVPFAVGTSVVSLGVGVGSRYGYGDGLFGGSSSQSPALSLSYERGVLALGPGYLGLGGIIGYQGATYDLGGGDKWHYSDVVLLARGAFHYPVSEKLDGYAGLGLGLRYLHTSYDGSLSGSGSDGSGYGTMGVFVGGRYFFTPAIGAFAELGYDQSYLKVGLAARF
ncbi:hypothetical protein [Hymenobacter sp. BRD67]|uniref:hypothetical protein n=1 Tax=Hymenobacter sp. BRD67 TaxID=2675877 RepID=UPI001566F3FB|nr:hypothetical protein [Hymenobacter sp. BRD67]QKG51390.1 hypothetical protein GKZ67_00810 [Hymenobacter sp. BRD67]